MDSSENIFEKQDRQRTEEAARWGLSDLEGFDRGFVQIEAARRISNENITDDTEKQRVYDEIKAQYLEYKASKETGSGYAANKKIEKENPRPQIPVKELPALSENVFEKQDQERNRKWTEHAAQWGYDDLDTFGKIDVKVKAEDLICKEGITGDTEKYEIYQIVKAQYLEYKAKQLKEIEERSKEHNEPLAAIDSNFDNLANEEPLHKQSATTLVEEELRQLKEEMKKIDERLRKLERYTEE